MSERSEHGGRDVALCSPVERTAMPEPTASISPHPRIAMPAAIGIALLVLFFGVFGAWAALATLQSAAIAPATIISEGKRKTVQHLEGGIVSEIVVHDGDPVKAGQVLLRLDDTQPRADLQILRVRRQVAAALQARLRAERDGLDQIGFPDWLLAATDDPTATEIMQGQENLFRARRTSVASQVAILEQRVVEFEEEINGLTSEIAAFDKQLALIGEEVEDLQQLFDKRLVPQSRLLALRRRAAAIEGERSRNVSNIARARQMISESRLRTAELEAARMTEVTQELRDTDAALFDLLERIRAAEDVIARTEIRAPLDGTVVNLQVHSPRGVVGPGEPLLEIVPAHDRLVVEAMVRPADIDVVHPGLRAQVRLTAFNSRAVLPLNGEVVYVSADILSDQRTGQQYYLARVELTDDVSAALDGAELYPGMAAQVMIATGRRTALDYVLRPVTRSLERAFREG
jgi:HlyD family type I secretion membrane fusion protein